MKTVEEFINDVIATEGGYCNDPQDKGGETNFGITKSVAVAFGFTGVMIDMQKEQAYQIYLQRYWIQPKLDQVFIINGPIAQFLLDTGVNMGPGTSIKLLQRCLNVLNGNTTLYPDMTVDGVLGAISLSYLGIFLKSRKTDGEEVLLKMLNGLRVTRYIEIAEGNKDQEKFIFGWIKNRIA